MFLILKIRDMQSFYNRIRISVDSSHSPTPRLLLQPPTSSDLFRPYQSNVWDNS